MDDQRAALNGDLETLPLQSVLKMLSMGDRTGYLQVISGTEEMLITLLHGQIASVEEPRHPSTDLVLAFQLLNRVDEPQAIQIRQMGGSNPHTIMTLLVQHQLMGHDELQKRVEHRVVTPLSHSMRWTSGQFSFRSDTTPMLAMAPHVQPLMVDYALLEANRLADEHAQQPHATRLPRHSIPRWRPEAPTRVSALSPSTDELNVFRLASGHLTLSGIAHALLLTEASVAGHVGHLLEVNMVELVDVGLEQAFAQHLMTLMDETRAEMSRYPRVSSEERLMVVVNALTLASNRLLGHHAAFAPSLRNRGGVRQIEVLRYLDGTFEPLLVSIRKQFPRMDGIVRMENGVIDSSDVETLHKVVKGAELIECYRDAAIMQSQLLQAIFERVLDEELGHSTAAEQLDGAWNDFTREIDYEIARLLGASGRALV